MSTRDNKGNLFGTVVHQNRLTYISRFKNIGYCPEFEAVFDELTAREHTKLYDRLRDAKVNDQRIEVSLNRYELTHIADKMSFN